MSDIVIVALISGGVSFMVAGVPLLFQRRKVSADAAEANTRANVALIEPLTKRIDKLESKVSALEKLNFDYLIGIKRLLRQLIGADMTPVWVPHEIDIESVKAMDEIEA